MSGQLQQSLLPTELWHVAKLGLGGEGKVETVPLEGTTKILYLYCNQHTMCVCILSESILCHSTVV